MMWTYAIGRTASACARTLSVVAAIALGGWTTAKAATSSQDIYHTGFEASEGYSTNLDLVGQNGWLGTPGNGIVTNFFPGYEQQAYIGYSAPTPSTNQFYFAYYPVNVAPVPTNEVLNFSVMMQITPSSTNSPGLDDFRWSVYNTGGARLFTLVFDNATKLVYYVLDDNIFVSAGSSFDNEGYYDLTITMNFAGNAWSANLNNQVVVNSKAITTLGSVLNLGDVDAVWGVADPKNPGDNYMLFDNYSISAQATASIPAQLQALGIGAGGAFQLRLYGETGLSYVVEASTDLVHWQTVSTVTVPTIGGSADVQDKNASGSTHEFYRARQGG
jgi:hypothetical protein